MKTRFENRFVLWMLVIGLTSIPAEPLPAQIFATLHSFAHADWAPGNPTNSDGALPAGGLALSGNTLFGTTGTGGSTAAGTIFAVNTDGTGFRTLHNFAALATNLFGADTNSDGAFPEASLIVSRDTLYGTAGSGGLGGSGTVFAINTNGRDFRLIHTFAPIRPRPAPYTNLDGTSPSGLILSGETLYGTTAYGGASACGTVFKVNTDGTGFTTLHGFTANTNASGAWTNNQGIDPHAGLVSLGSTLYGTTYAGGINGCGTVFALQTNGTGFRTLHTFTVFDVATNQDGYYPLGELALAGGTLYGTAPGGGTAGQGTVYAVNIDGTGFRTLHNFGATSPFPYPSTNSDGSIPTGGLTLAGHTLYGTTSGGGNAMRGTVFSINTDGTGFSVLHSFERIPGFPMTNSDGASPAAPVVISGNTLYGTAPDCGAFGEGTVFSILTLPPLSLGFTGDNVVLSWPTNASGFSLQSTTDLGPNALWTTNLPPQVLVNGQSTVTLPNRGTQQFFRLSQ